MKNLKWFEVLHMTCGTIYIITQVTSNPFITTIHVHVSLTDRYSITPPMGLAGLKIKCPNKPIKSPMLPRGGGGVVGHNIDRCIIFIYGGHPYNVQRELLLYMYTFFFLSFL